jgi:LPS-assembly lipoprotein
MRYHRRNLSEAPLRIPGLCALLFAAALLLAACGFQLRGTARLPFETLYVEAAPTSPFAIQLKRVVQSGTTTRVTDRREEAQAILHVLGEWQEKQVLSLGGTGRVREFQLRYRVAFRLTDVQNREHIPASEIVLRRDYSFNDEQVLSKEQEEALLFRDMRTDAVQQLVRRLQAAKIKG